METVIRRTPDTEPSVVTEGSKPTPNFDDSNASWVRAASSVTSTAGKPTLRWPVSDTRGTSSADTTRRDAGDDVHDGVDAAVPNRPEHRETGIDAHVNSGLTFVGDLVHTQHGAGRGAGPRS